MHRAAGGVQVGLRDLLPAGRQAGRRSTSTPRAATPTSTGSSGCSHASDLPKRISWEDFEKKGYYLVPVPEDHEPTPALRWFAEGRQKDTPDWGPPPWDHGEAEGLQTQSGKIEFVARSLTRFYETGDASTRNAPSWVRSTSRAGRAIAPTELYGEVPAAADLAAPALQLPHHGRRQGRLEPTTSRTTAILKDDGRYYWIIRLNREDAAARGHRRRRPRARLQRPGSVILAARVTERVPPGHRALVRVVRGLRAAGARRALARPAGCVNILTSKRFITPTSPGPGPQLLPGPGGEVGGGGLRTACRPRRRRRWPAPR